ncbi:MAG: M14 family metallopeptidase [Polyangiaceae bacterium]
MTLSASALDFAVQPAPLGYAGYADAELLSRDFSSAARALGANTCVVGASVGGRALLRFDFGTPGKPVVLLSSLMHGVEVIGALALLDLMRTLSNGSAASDRLMQNAHFVALPIVNPDALTTNLARVTRGLRAWQRCNQSGVDLNRNFPHVTRERLYHPFAGSRFRVSPHYTGPHALSEPESRAVCETARATRPLLSLGFHSIGNVLLYPWAHTKRQNPRAAEYRELGGVLAGAQRRYPYRVAQAREMYSVLGDMDDWLDTELGTLAFTVEVGRPRFDFRRVSRWFNPFAWMNPEHAGEIVSDLTPGLLALLGAKLGVARS